MFGNELSELRVDDEVPEVPVFLVRCVRRLEELMEAVGIYRVNGDAAAVQKVRLDVDRDNWKTLETTRDVSLLASTLKLFFRELPEPLIGRETRDRLYGCAYEKGDALAASIRRAIDETMDVPRSKEVLRYSSIYCYCPQGLRRCKLSFSFCWVFFGGHSNVAINLLTFLKRKTFSEQ